MRVVTMVSLGASAALGLSALVVAKMVLPNQAAAKIAASASAQAPGVSVVVAAKPLKYGDRLDAEHLRLIQVPADAAPEGAFTTIAAVLSADHGGAPVALAPIAERETVLPTKVSGPGARPSVAAEIGEGMRAYTIKVTDVSGVGGHALPGDRVDVVLLREVSGGSGSAQSFVSQVVLQDVRVLAIDLNADLASNKPATPNTATLEVTVEASQKLAVAADLGKLSLALRRTGSSEPADITSVRSSQLVGGGVAAPAARPRRSAGSSYGPPILIVYGERRGSGGGRRAPPAAPAAPPPVAAPAASNAADAMRPSFG